jgi:cytochrome c oxidase assembly protein subunit 15
MSDVGRASVQRLLRVLATVGAALVVVVIVSSAYLRLAGAGLSCADWPSCYGQITQAGGVTTAQRGARLAHRLSASAAGVILFALLAVAVAQRPRLAKQALIAGAGLLVAALLATIGALSSEGAHETQLPAVTLANLGGGFALLALLAWLRQTSLPVTTGAPGSAPALSPGRGLKLLAAGALVAVIGQIALGALVSAKFAALACPAFPLCGAPSSLQDLLQAFDPFVALDVDASRSIVRPQALASLHWAHRWNAHVVLIVAALLAVALARQRFTRLANTLATLVVIQLALGASAVLAGLPLPVVLAHNLVAAALVSVLVVINYRIRNPVPSLRGTD